MQFLRKLLDRFNRFMYGRYGADALFYVLFGAFFVLNLAGNLQHKGIVFFHRRGKLRHRRIFFEGIHVKIIFFRADIDIAWLHSFPAREEAVAGIQQAVMRVGKGIPVNMGFIMPLGNNALIFILLYTPCVAAVAAIRRELDSAWKTCGVVLFQCLLAWVLGAAVYQIALLI